ncbi:7tm odorant receptor [Holotrichia oblita]|uniref:7tm odorant receptor n=1 Tax=Holotrichia oblita TaxID=644536 RepID=A0ACB9TEQ2_HOLOL|nr:7tm odorant receptor [Holotrichia oblita]
MCNLIVVFVSGTLKIILILIFRKRITAFCELIETKPFLPDPHRSGDIEFDYVQEAINACNYQGYTFHIFVVAIVLPKIFYSLRDSEYETVFNDFQNVTFLVQRQRAGPFNCVMPFNTINSPYFEITAIYQASCAAILGCVIGSIDAIICGIMCHVKAQILILKKSLGTYIQQGLFLMEEDNIDGKNVIGVDEFEMIRNSKTSIQLENVPISLQKYVDISVTQIIIHHQKIVRGSGSYFMVLRSINMPEE